MNATSHNPVLLTEVVSALAVQPEGIYVDGTFGRGGHSALLLARLGKQGRLLCLDKDPEAVAFGKARFQGDSRVIVRQGCFSQIATFAEACGWKGAIQGVLLDLGISSLQLADPQRGLSFQQEGPLDMRLDPQGAQTAAEWLEKASQEEITWVLRHYGEEPFARGIAKRICREREERAIQTTTELAALVARSVPRPKRGRHPATRTFQAIRIHINQELQALEDFLQTIDQVLKVGARVAVISFHSLEDRRVKQHFQKLSVLPKDLLRMGMLLERAPYRWVTKRCFPSKEEVENNRRARSAILRVAEKCS